MCGFENSEIAIIKHKTPFLVIFLFCYLIDVTPYFNYLQLTYVNGSYPDSIPATFGT